MKPKRKHLFILTPVSSFDARRVCRRCELAGVGNEVDGTQLYADFWHATKVLPVRHNPKKVRREGAEPMPWVVGQVVVRFSCRGHRYHFAAFTSKAKPLMEVSWEFGDFIMETLFDWGCEGLDDLPNSICLTL